MDPPLPKLNPKCLRTAEAAVSGSRVVADTDSSRRKERAVRKQPTNQSSSFKTRRTRGRGQTIRKRPPPPKKGSNFISSVGENLEYATLWGNMGERETLDQQNGTKSPRLRLRHTGGKIVEVQGGHIVRSLARKDRHSKVCTAKGPRDRRLRLSAHTAIQFYDVQDRLGYDSPSKAVDWLIKEAKSAVDELANLPAWTPTLDSIANVGLERNQKQQEEPQQRQREHPLSGISSNSWGTNTLHMNGDNLGEKNSSFAPLSLDSDTIQSFFPLGASNSSVTQFQSVPPPPGLIPRTSHGQDLGLSLQSFQDPIFHRHEQSLAHNAPSSAWSKWNAGGGGGGGFMFNPLPSSLPLFGQNQCVSQGGPLQSINTQSVRAWIDPASSIAAAAADHHLHHHNNNHLPSLPIFSWFSIPAQFQGEEEEHYGISDKPSSISSDSRH